MNCAALRPIGEALLPEAKGKKKKKNPPQRNNVDVRLTDGELTLIKQWEIHFQREEATCGDETTLGYRDKARRLAQARKHYRYPQRSHEPVTSDGLCAEEENVLFGCHGHENTLQHVAVRAAYWLPALLSPPHPPPPQYHSSPHSLV